MRRTGAKCHVTVNVNSAKDRRWAAYRAAAKHSSVDVTYTAVGTV